MVLREIPKIPKCPPLNDQLIHDLTALCFRKDDAHIPNVDCVFVFGTAVSFKELGESLSALLSQKITRQLVITGGLEKYHDSWHHEIPEAEMIFDAIKGHIPKDIEVHLEKASQNTLENVLFAKEMLPNHLSSMCYVSKGFHAGRCRLTLKKIFPNISLFQHTFVPIYPTAGFQFRSNNWHTNPEYAGRVYGEFLRIKSYGERGDLNLQEAKVLLNNIDKHLNL
jgi:uncharacterized SAM-binding protein YcdF (DUF218 family)